MSIFAPTDRRLTWPRTTEPNPVAGPFVSKAKTEDEFLKELEGLLVLECRTFGPGAQNARTVYQPIGQVFIYEDAHTPWNPFAKPSIHWWTGDDMSPAEAEACTKKYDCWATEAYYRPEGSDAMILMFRSFDACARWVWDHRSGDLGQTMYAYLVVTYEGETIKWIRRIFEKRPDVHKNPYELCRQVLSSNQAVIPLEQATPEMLKIAVEQAR